MRFRCLIAVLACSCTAAPGPVTPADPSSACIELEPPAVEFGPLSLPEDGPETRTVTISNPCAGDLEIATLGLDETGTPFRLGLLDSKVVAAGEETWFDVTFDPASSGAPGPGTFSTRAVITSSAPGHEREVVPLTGEAEAPVIAVTPREIDFGAPFFGCLEELAVHVTNAGTAPLTLQELEFTTAAPGEFSFPDRVLDAEGRPVSRPVVIAPAEAVDVLVDYRPLDLSEDSGFLAIISNDPFKAEVVIAAHGTGARYGGYLDAFRQPGRSLVDVVLTLDRSESMAAVDESVVANLDALVDRLARRDADYRVAIVVEDDGCVLGADDFVDETFSASSAAAAFRTMADLGFTLGTDGVNHDAGFSLAAAALSPENLGSGGCNEGLVRPDAALVLVHVSDQAEGSVDPFTHYVARFESLKDDRDDVTIHAIAGDYPDGCDGAAAGLGYYEATVATGGEFLSICDGDRAAQLASLAEHSAAINDHFTLTQVPVRETIRVRVDGIEVPAGWAYDASTNRVWFEESFLPEPGADVEIEYELMPRDCTN